MATRPNFPTDPLQAQAQTTAAIKEVAKELKILNENIERIILALSGVRRTR